ncbi:MAG: DUF58 domain-containing protein [Acidobacteria bacterium]|nr:DUF58 domain-containing protein [Acidobacteriota bacterium]
MATQSLIDKSFLEKLERLALHWQRSFAGLVGGHNRSHFPGPGQEFLDHRHFHHGDDLRAVNWRAYLRLEKLFLKMFQVEPRVPVRLLIDVSQSMSTGAISKFDYARRLAAALCYIGLVRLDAITIYPFSDRLGDPFLCCGGRHRLAPTVDYLGGLSTGGRTGYFEVVRQFVSASPQRGLLIVLSDFLDERDCTRPLQFLADFGHELMLVHLWADEDRTPPWDGDLELTDAESGERMEIAFGPDARQAFTATFDEWARSLQEAVVRGGGRYAGLPTSTSIEDAVFGPLVRSRGIE